MSLKRRSERGSVSDGDHKKLYRVYEPADNQCGYLPVVFATHIFRKGLKNRLLETMTSCLALSHEKKYQSSNLTHDKGLFRV